MSPIKLITFDVTNTIIRVLGSVGKTYSAVAGIYGQTISSEEIDNKFKLAYKKHITDLPNFGVHNGLTSKGWWDGLVIDTLKAAGASNKNLPIISSHLYRLYSTSKGWEIIDGAETTLLTLRTMGFRLGIVSNFDERLETILHALCLSHHFEFVLASAVERCAKPDPEIYRLALQMAGVKAEECVHIGDNVTNDFNGPRSVGMQAILCSSKPAPYSVDERYTVQNLSDVSHLIKQIAQSP